jgi:hypothetical protein
MSKLTTDFNAASKEEDPANLPPMFAQPSLAPTTSAILHPTSSSPISSNSQSTLPTPLTAPATVSGLATSVFSETSSVPKISASQGKPSCFQNDFILTKSTGGMSNHGVTQNQPSAVKIGGNMFKSGPSFGKLPEEPLPSKHVHLELDWSCPNSRTIRLPTCR